MAQYVSFVLCPSSPQSTAVTRVVVRFFIYIFLIYIFLQGIKQTHTHDEFMFFRNTSKKGGGKEEEKVWMGGRERFSVQSRHVICPFAGDGVVFL